MLWYNSWVHFWCLNRVSEFFFFLVSAFNLNSRIQIIFLTESKSLTSYHTVNTIENYIVVSKFIIAIIRMANINIIARIKAITMVALLNTITKSSHFMAIYFSCYKEIEEKNIFEGFIQEFMSS